MGITSLYFQYKEKVTYTVFGVPKFGVQYLSLSVSLNVLLTMMIVVQLSLHGSTIRAATGSLAGISGLYKTVSIILIESCAIFTLNSSLVIGALAAVAYSSDNGIFVIGSFVVDIFFPILAETQVRAFPLPPSPGLLSNATMDWTGDRSTAHHSASRQWERVDRPHYYHWTHQFVRC